MSKATDLIEKYKVEEAGKSVQDLLNKGDFKGAANFGVTQLITVLNDLEMALAGEEDTADVGQTSRIRKMENSLLGIEAGINQLAKKL